MEGDDVLSRYLYRRAVRACALYEGVSGGIKAYRAERDRLLPPGETVERQRARMVVKFGVLGWLAATLFFLFRPGGGLL